MAIHEVPEAPARDGRCVRRGLVAMLMAMLLVAMVILCSLHCTVPFFCLGGANPEDGAFSRFLSAFEDQEGNVPPKEGSWCSFTRSSFRCNEHRCWADSSCAWFQTDAVTAVIFSDRLRRTQMTTVKGFCSFTPAQVLVVLQDGSSGSDVPSHFLSCRLITARLGDIEDHLRALGFKPESICAAHIETKRNPHFPPPSWDSDYKHHICANHLRFYLGYFPIFKNHARVIFVDDDVVVRRNPAELYKTELEPTVLITANCDVNIWNNKCQRFDVAFSDYFHFWNLSEATTTAYAELDSVLAEAGAPKYDRTHPEWNFGFNLFNLDLHRELNFSHMYERLAAAMLEHKLVRADSLFYGLGAPFLAYQQRVQCYNRRGWYVVDGLGYVPPVEMSASGWSSKAVLNAPAAHFNGHRKPWSTNAYLEYLSERAENGIFRDTPLKLIVLLTGPRSGTEWLVDTLTEDQTFCGDIDLRNAPHPEGLMPFQVKCSSDTVPCCEWKTDLPNPYSCNLRDLCQWRSLITIIRWKGSPANMNAQVLAWRRWGRSRDATDIFENYMRRLLRLPTSAPPLTCDCERGQKFLIQKLFLGWLGEKKHKWLNMDGAHHLARFGKGTWSSPDVLAVFRKLDATVLYMHRDPLDQYVSIQRGQLTRQWHCFKKKVEDCANFTTKMHFDPLDIMNFIGATNQMQSTVPIFAPKLSISFSTCMANANGCIAQIYQLLGLPPRTTEVQQPRVHSLWETISNVEEIQEAMNASAKLNRAHEDARLARLQAILSPENSSYSAIVDGPPETDESSNESETFASQPDYLSQHEAQYRRLRSTWKPFCVSWRSLAK